MQLLFQGSSSAGHNIPLFIFLSFSEFWFFHWVLYILITERFSSCQVARVQGKSWTVKIQDASKPVPKLLFNYSSGWPWTVYPLDPAAFNHRKSDLNLPCASCSVWSFMLILYLMCKCSILLCEASFQIVSTTMGSFLLYIYFEKSQKSEMRTFTKKKHISLK